MDTFYNKYIKYKSKYFELKGYSIDKIATINTYKSKHINEFGLVGGVGGTEPCPAFFGTLHSSIFWYLRNKLCTYSDFIKKLDPSDIMWTNFTWTEFQRTNGERNHVGKEIEVRDLKERGFPALYLTEKGFPLEELRKGGYTIADLIKPYPCQYPHQLPPSETPIQDIGYTPGYLKYVGYTIEEFHEYKKSLVFPRIPDCFSIKKLLDYEFSPSEIKSIGFTIYDFLNLIKYDKTHSYNVSPSLIIKAGFSADEILELPETYNDDIYEHIRSLKRMGYSIVQLKIFSKKTLRLGGFEINDFMKAGFTAEQLKKAGFTISDIIKCYANQLKEAGFTAIQLKSAGLSEDLLISVGFNAFEVE